jgi:hypothetical protein
VKRVVALGALALVLAGCGGTSSPSSAPAKPMVSPSVAPASLSTADLGCDHSVLPAGFSVDKAHSGRLTAHTYSASADVQAALEFDKLQSGARRVYVHHSSDSRRAVDGVASCISLQFASPALAIRFFGSYQTLRRQAGSLVARISPAPLVSGLRGTTAYYEKQQAFRGYGISSTNVIEVAGLHGQTLDIASIAGTSPAVSVATNLLKTTVRGA